MTKLVWRVWSRDVLRSQASANLLDPDVSLFKYDCCEAPSRSGLIYGALPNPALPSAGADVSLPPQLPTLGGCMSATGARP